MIDLRIVKGVKDELVLTWGRGEGNDRGGDVKTP